MIYQVTFLFISSASTRSNLLSSAKTFKAFEFSSLKFKHALLTKKLTFQLLSTNAPLYYVLNKISQCRRNWIVPIPVPINTNHHMVQLAFFVPKTRQLLNYRTLVTFQCLQGVIRIMNFTQLWLWIGKVNISNKASTLPQYGPEILNPCNPWSWWGWGVDGISC